jgi:hypothetical protein
VKSQSRAPQMTARAGFAVSGIDLPPDGSVERTGTRRRISGGRADRSFRAAVKFGRPAPTAHLSMYTWQEMALWAIESNRHLDVCSLCALPLSAKYDFIERYCGFNCVSRHGHMLKISPFLP